ncbi:MAG: cell division protein FtsX, partial [Rhodobacterales bacterium]|nr:cell division protein FtsX [Rhodobacterales bacterium]
MTWAALLRDVLAVDRQADRVVPPTGHTAWLTGASAAAMAFLAVFALALSLASGRLADRWSEALARTATIRISAPPDQMALQTQAVLDVLATTPGIAGARALSDDEQRALLEPWLGPGLPLDSLPVPRLVELTETGAGYDAEGLRQRLAAEAPGALLDDHQRWRRPLAVAAGRLRALGGLSVVLILGTMAAMITLAAQAALAANGQVIRVLRLVGARDAYIARAFVRRFTLRARYR